MFIYFRLSRTFSSDAHLAFKAPKFDFISNARPSLFAYPSPTKPPKKEAVTKVAAAVLSTTAKAKAREKKKAAAEGEAIEVVSIFVLNSGLNQLVDRLAGRKARGKEG